jgi:hypothetical protein
MISQKIAVLMPVMTAIAVAATRITTILPAAAQQSIIHITHDGTNSYTISGGSSSVGSFDITYRVAGESSAIMSAENLTIYTIIDDFSSSPTKGISVNNGSVGNIGITNSLGFK